MDLDQFERVVEATQRESKKDLDQPTEAELEYLSSSWYSDDLSQLKMLNVIEKHS